MVAPWQQLTSLNQIDKIIEDSNNKTIAIFKHSTRCGVSSHAMHKLEDSWQFDEKQLDFYYLDLLNYRNISNEIADRFSVIHQSPQLIIIKNGKAVYDISHQGVSNEVIGKFL